MCCIAVVPTHGPARSRSVTGGVPHTEVRDGAGLRVAATPGNYGRLRPLLVQNSGRISWPGAAARRYKIPPSSKTLNLELFMLKFCEYLIEIQIIAMFFG